METPPSLDKVVFCPLKCNHTSTLSYARGEKRALCESEGIDSILPKLTKI